eukprot:TRINITY_DN10238_c0_g1_i2.p1 TRINITY_DN10238_c0_g1~~TRINITY_DN10238_c0_g1_i2.p1  ORF type:complete len:238 (-),score=70.69 TRINITY_DN10238_c0_g1_i2:341-1054(-)
MEHCWNQELVSDTEVLGPAGLEQVVRRWYQLQHQDMRLVLIAAHKQLQNLASLGSVEVASDELGELADFVLNQFEPAGVPIPAESRDGMKQELLAEVGSNQDRGTMGITEFQDWCHAAAAKLGSEQPEPAVAESLHGTMDDHQEAAVVEETGAPAEDQGSLSVKEQVEEALKRFEFEPDQRLWFHEFAGMLVQCAVFEEISLCDQVSVEILCKCASKKDNTPKPASPKGIFSCFKSG